VIAHFLAIPTCADAELETATRQVIDRRDLLGRDDRVALDDEADAAANPQARGRLGGRGQRDEQVVGVPVLGWQDRPAGPRRLAAGGDVRVFGEEQRLVAALLDKAGDLARRQRVVQ
jgi:hypothetical protein